MSSLRLRELEAVVVDMDGVLWVGDRPLPGLREFFTHLSRRGIPYVLATNNASRSPGYYVRKLAHMGVRTTEAHILTSAMAAADWLATALPAGARVFVVGQEGLRDALHAAGFGLVEGAIERAGDGPAPRAAREAAHGDDVSPADAALLAALPRASDRVAAADAVVAGIDFDLTYNALRDATLLIRRGARFVGTNGDLTYPSEVGLVPGAGSILAAISAATGVAPTIIGKPERHLFDAAIGRLGHPRDRTAMVGDRLDTDILGAQRAGLRTILVTTGVDGQEAVARTGIVPDLTTSGLDELVRTWR